MTLKEGAAAPAGTDGSREAEAPLDMEDRASVQRLYARIRADTESLARHLAPEDMVVQSMPDASPTKWHLAHTTWFFETFLLTPHARGHRPREPQYAFLFNSYYNQVGPQFPRPRRGLLSRPSVAEIFDYRADIDDAMARFIAGSDAATWRRCGPLAVLGLHHEQQHQELIATDIKHALAQNPLAPAAFPRPPRTSPGGGTSPPMPARPEWVAFAGGRMGLGRDTTAGSFAYDNEGPRHDVLLRPFRLRSHPVSNGEFRAFIDDGGYRRAELWLSDGWSTVREQGWQAPPYWRFREDGSVDEFTLFGARPLDPAAPVVHLSLYEAAAYATWAGARLPYEAELEAAAAGPVTGNFGIARGADGLPGGFHPRADTGAATAGTVRQIFGDVWEWTQSAYSAYPGYRPTTGAIGEYNGKFMCNQMVLRGGSCATPPGHVRPTYRNFFPPDARWQFTGLRLADDL